MCQKPWYCGYFWTRIVLPSFIFLHVWLLTALVSRSKKLNLQFSIKVLWGLIPMSSNVGHLGSNIGASGWCLAWPVTLLSSTTWDWNWHVAHTCSSGCVWCILSLFWSQMCSLLSWLHLFEPVSLIISWAAFAFSTSNFMCTFLQTNVPLSLHHFVINCYFILYEIDLSTTGALSLPSESSCGSGKAFHHFVNKGTLG